MYLEQAMTGFASSFLSIVLLLLGQVPQEPVVGFIPIPNAQHETGIWEVKLVCETCGQDVEFDTTYCLTHGPEQQEDSSVLLLAGNHKNILVRLPVGSYRVKVGYAPDASGNTPFFDSVSLSNLEPEKSYIYSIHKQVGHNSQSELNGSTFNGQTVDINDVPVIHKHNN